MQMAYCYPFFVFGAVYHIATGHKNKTK